jgi:hypothetical protein
MTAPKFNQAPKYVVTAVNPQTGAVAMESFIDGDYTDWDSTIRNDENQMNYIIRHYVMNQYPVVVSQTKLDESGAISYQVVILIHRDSITCDCGKGFLCPLNTQQVNYFKGKVVSKKAVTL